MHETKAERPSMPFWAAFGLVLLAAVGLFGTLYLAAFARTLRGGGLLSAAMHAVSRDPFTLALAQVAGVAVAVPFGLWLFARETPPKDALGIAPVPLATLGLALLAGCALQFPLTEIANVMRHFAPVSIEEQMTRQALLTPSSPIASVLVVFAVVGLAPVSEEVLFRGLLGRLLTERYGPVVGIGLSALLFGAVHGGTLAFVYASCAGLYLGVLAHTTRSILPGIVVHGATNAVPLLLSRGAPPIRGFNAVSDTVYHLPPAVVVSTTLVALTALFAMTRNAR